LKLSQDSAACVRFPDVHKVELDPGDGGLKIEPKNFIGSGSAKGKGGNSGFQAFNLAVQFSSTKIILVGFDMRIDRGVHWHGKHNRGLCNPRPPTIKHWIDRLDGEAEKLKALGVDVVNASPDSALQAYPKLSIEEAFARWQEQRV